jgi:hypothetical protein
LASARLYPLERILLVCVLVLMALAWWVIADELPEGTILFTVSTGKGLTMIDLPGVVLCVAAAWLLRPAAWKRHRRRH